MTLAEQLNKYKVEVSFTRGEPTVTALPDNLDDLCNEQGEVTDPTFSEYLDWLDTVSFDLEEHPRYGKDGGYVPVATDTNNGQNYDTAWWDNNDGRWCD